jgi:zinc protease
VPQTTTLSNGLTLIVVQRKEAALSSIVFVTKHGGIDDGKLPGLATFSGEMLQAGSAGRSASQIAEEVTALGTELHLGASREDLTATLTVLPEKHAQATQLLGEIILSPNLARKELERVRQQTRSKLVAQLDSPRAVAANAMDKVLYGESPYGTPLFGTQASVAKVKLADVKRFLATIGGASSAVVVVGPLPLAEVQPLVEKAFGKLPAGKPMPKLASHAVDKRPSMVVLDKPGAPQSVVRMAEPGIAANDPDRYALRLADTIFGGSFTSRINQNLREAHGYTYGAGAQFVTARGGGTFQLSTDVKTEVTAASIYEIDGELAKMTSPGLDQAELDKAKALFTENLVSALQTTPSTARAVAELWVDDLPMGELSSMLPAVSKLTLTEVNAAWKKAVDAGKLSFVVVGDAKSIEAQLQEQKLPKPVRMAPVK